jgi:hypothetical protein
VTTPLWVALAIVLVACYVTWTAGRLDRLHASVDAQWAALDAQLVRRAAAARGLLPLLPDGPARRDLDTASAAALDAGEVGRELIENQLTRALRTALPVLPDEPDAVRAKAELEAIVTRVGLARSFHNSSVLAARTVRRRRLPRALRLAGHRALPAFFDVDDTALA